MKFVPTLCAATALLLLSACSTPAPGAERVAEEAKIVIGEGMPKPTQTTWATAEPTPTESAKSSVTPSDSMLDECEKLDKAIAYRFQMSGVKCAQVLELRARFVQEVGEEMADWGLLTYHSEYCTENSGQTHGEELPYIVKPGEKTHGEELPYIVKLGESKPPTGNLEDGERHKYVPCRTPQQ